MEDERVKVEIAKLELPEGTVIVCDPWIYGKVDHLVLIKSPANDFFRI